MNKIITNLVTCKTISITIETKIESISLFKDKEEIELVFNHQEGNTSFYDVKQKILLGNDYILHINNQKIRLDVTNAIHFKDFDLEYTYLSSDLGSNYTKEFTDFALWAPLAYKVYLHLVDENKKVKMKRDDYGVYRVHVEGNLDGAKYRYIVHVNNEVNEVSDPYAKSSFINGVSSAVINIDKLKDIPLNEEYLPPFKENVEAIIYELSVRDMTMSKYTDIEHKGKYLGLAEEGRKTTKGNPAGLDYLKWLGVTHIQLLPVLDFKTIDESNPNRAYNWGYDPMHMFTLEGSYSLNPDDPYSRMREFKTMVSTLHRAGIRVNLDVVYNHVYEVRENSLQKITPFYFFRHTPDYKFIEHSFCGDDFASERPMAKKMIVDSINFLMRTYGVDGFRFDLMGLIDIMTMKEIDRISHSIKPNVMLYGEGWDMFAVTSNNIPLAHMNNAHLLPRIGFFNDRYRNIVRGSGGSTPLEACGYLLGNESYYDGFKFVLLGSCLDVTYQHLFLSPNQSINYVECHDNATLYDAINTSLRDSDEEVLERIKLINRVIIHSFGIPFFHAGQEIGATKFGNGNTYNKGDRYNLFAYDLLDKNISLASDLKNMIALRKFNTALKISDPKELFKMVDFTRKENCLIFSIDYPKENKDYYFFVNPTKRAIYRTFKGQAEQVIGFTDKLKVMPVSEAMSFPLTMQLYRKFKVNE